MFERQDGLAKILQERMDELDELQAEYDSINRQLEPNAKSERIEEILMKVELVLSMLIKVERNLIEEMEDPKSYMYRSDLVKTLEQVKSYTKSFQGMAFAMSEVLRSVRIKIENIYELQKLTLDMSSNNR